MTACCETTRADLTSAEVERGDGSSALPETDRRGGVASNEDGNQARLNSKPSSQEVFDGTRAVEPSAPTEAQAGKYDGGELCKRERVSVGENNADSNAVIFQDLGENAGVSVSLASGKTILRELPEPVCSYYPANEALLDSLHATTTTTATSPSSGSKFTTLVQNTNAFVGNESRRPSHQDAYGGWPDVTDSSFTPRDDGRPASGACVGNETASNNFVTSHRSGSAAARDNSRSSPGLAGFGRETVSSHISPPVPGAVDHYPCQSAAGHTSSATTLNNELKSNSCTQRGSSIPGSDYSPCLDSASENTDKHACSYHLAVSEQTDDESSITKSQNGCVGLKYSLQDYFISPEESCRGLCNNSSPSFSVDDLFTDNITLGKYVDTEQTKCSQPLVPVETGARLALNEASICTRIPTLELHISEAPDTSGHCQSPKTRHWHRRVNIRNSPSKVSSLDPSSWDVPDHSVHPCLSQVVPVHSTPLETTSCVAVNKQQALVVDIHARQTASCHISIEPTKGCTQDTDPRPDHGDRCLASRISSASSDLACVTSACNSSAPSESTDQTVHSHSLIGSLPHARSNLSDLSIIGNEHTRLSVSDSDQSTEAVNDFTVENTSRLGFRRFSGDHIAKTHQPLTVRHANELSFQHGVKLPRNQGPPQHNRTEESQHSFRRPSLNDANRTLSTSSEEWSDTASPCDNYYTDEERRSDSNLVSLADTSNNALQQRRRSFGRQRQLLKHNLGAFSPVHREGSGHTNETASDEEGCDASSALLTADSDDDFQEQSQIDGFASCSGKSNNACDGVALVSKQQFPDRTRNLHEKALSGRTHFSRLVQLYCRDILRIRNNSDSSNHNSACLPSAYIATTCRELNAESSDQLARVSAVNINTTTTTTVATTSSESTARLSASAGATLPGATASGKTEGASKPRVSFISGLRRLSRDRTAFLRVDHSDSSGRECSSPASSHLQDVPADAQVHKSGKRIGTGDRKKLKVEFAVMEAEGDKYIRGRGRAYGGGSFGGGIHNVKEDVENDVAMLGGGGLRFRQPRVSLLGKPLNYRAHRRDIKYRKLQSRIYNFLERPKSWQSWIYHLTV
ncbi:hypothetical protein BsWGS_24099 [Bradybaena similaris]